MSERYQSGKALSRAEIGVLLSYAKIVLFDDLVEGDLPDDPYFRETLMDYFPAKMHKAHVGDIAIACAGENHRDGAGKRRHQRGGPAFVSTMMDLTGALPSEVVKAAVLARDGCGLSRIQADIDALDTVIDRQIQNELWDVSRVFAVVTERALRTKATSALTKPSKACATRWSSSSRALQGSLPADAAQQLQASSLLCGQGCACRACGRGRRA